MLLPLQGDSEILRYLSHLANLWEFAQFHSICLAVLKGILWSYNQWSYFVSSGTVYNVKTKHELEAIEKREYITILYNNTNVSMLTFYLQDKSKLTRNINDWTVIRAIIYELLN